ncbi:MAG: ATPase, T2SS/T4P/T4SS family [Acidimicrobiia bacterium]
MSPRQDAGRAQATDRTPARKGPPRDATVDAAAADSRLHDLEAQERAAREAKRRAEREVDAARRSTRELSRRRKTAERAARKTRKAAERAAVEARESVAREAAERAAVEAKQRKEAERRAATAAKRATAERHEAQKRAAAEQKEAEKRAAAEQKEAERRAAAEQREAAKRAAAEQKEAEKRAAAVEVERERREREQREREPAKQETVAHADAERLRQKAAEAAAALVALEAARSARQPMREKPTEPPGGGHEPGTAPSENGKRVGPAAEPPPVVDVAAAEREERPARPDAAETVATRAAAPAAAPATHRQLGSLLVADGALTDEQLTEALGRQAQSRLGEYLVGAGVVQEADVVVALGQQLGYGVADLRRQAPEPGAVELLGEPVARMLGVIPLRRHNGNVQVAVADPLAPQLEQRLRDAIGANVEFVLAPKSDITRAIDRSYNATARVDDVVRAFEVLHSDRGDGDTEARPAVDDNAPIVKVVNLLLEQAVRDRASDVHIEPREDRVRIRNRTDGALHDVLSLPASMAQSLVSRIKIMADMNIVERRRAQDGQFAATVSGRDLDVRVATTSTVYGEKCVLRLLDKSRALLELSQLGMPADTEERFKELVRSPYGMVLCAGPTGSGKTTTLYATVMEINRPEINVTTIEDPVEYVFEEINQIQINEQAGITFAGGLRSILRQDPDSILVGEIRDVETARIAVQSALTGHFVMSSLHATDASAALHRFLDMGIEPFLVASSLVGVVSQRLVRKICPSCKTPYQPSIEDLAFYERVGGPEVEQFFRGEGCNFCAHTGYLERIGVYEVLRVTEEIRRQILDGAPAEAVRATAIEQGMRPLATEAATLVAQGVTTIDEVIRTIYVF